MWPPGNTMEWNTTEFQTVCTTMMDILRELNEYENFAKLCARETATDEDRVVIALQYLCKFNLLPFKKTDKREGFFKSSKTSVEHRNEGNKHFMKNNRVALMCYSKSIASAPYPTSEDEDSEELALAFANRSAVYFVVKKYDACLRDIEQALVFGYPDKLKYKLLERRAKCYQNMGKKEEARSSAQDAVQHLSSATHLPEDKMQATIDALNKLGLHPCAVQCQPSLPTVASKPLPQKSYGQHKKIPCASESVDIKYKQEGGRHVVANRDIEPGDVLFVEEPYASVLKQQVDFEHCNNCTKWSDAMIPCRQCDQVMYCSETCRIASWETFHRIECQVVPELMRLDVGNVFLLLALRMLLVACSQNNGIIGLLKLEQELKQQQTGNKVKGFDRNGNYLSFDYYQVHHLFGNVRKEAKIQITQAVSAACILNCLDQYIDFFPSESNDSAMGVRTSTGGLLLKYIRIACTNTFSVDELVRRVNTEEYEDVNIASAVYSTLSLLNHSCDPTACRSFHNGSVNVVFARQPIKQGEEVTISYKGHYKDTDGYTRRRKLRGYCFECRCIACTNNWPLYDGLEPIKDPTFICKTCRIPLPKTPLTSPHQWVVCKTCKKKYNVLVMLAELAFIEERVKYINEAIDTINYPDYTSEFARYIKSVYAIRLHPNQLIETCQYFLVMSMKASGNLVVE